MLASFLPLPADPHAHVEVTPSQLDVEQAIAPRVQAIDEKRFLKGKWWRNLNRIMSVGGTLLIGTIVSLLTLQLSNSRSFWTMGWSSIEEERSAAAADRTYAQIALVVVTVRMGALSSAAA